MKEFMCEICEKVFNNRNTLSKHFNYQHNNSGNEKAYLQM